MSNVYQTPESNLVKDVKSAETYGSIDKSIIGDYEFSIGAVLSEAWSKTNGCKGVFNLSFSYYFLVLIAVMIAMSVVTAGLVSVDDMDMVAGEVPLSMFFMQIMIQLGVSIVLLPMGMGLVMIAIRRSVDAPVSASMVFKYYSKIMPLFVTMLLVYSMIIIGFLLFVIPGIYLMVAYYMAMPLVVEKGMTPWQAMETSRKAITHRWFSVFGLFMVLTFIIVVSAIPLGIGMIWTMPMLMVAFAILYRNMFGVETETIL